MQRGRVWGCGVAIQSQEDGYILLLCGVLNQAQKDVRDGLRHPSPHQRACAAEAGDFLRWAEEQLAPLALDG
jgi:hypothetical protein